MSHASRFIQHISRLRPRVPANSRPFPGCPGSFPGIPRIFPRIPSAFPRRAACSPEIPARSCGVPLFPRKSQHFPPNSCGFPPESPKFQALSKTLALSHLNRFRPFEAGWSGLTVFVAAKGPNIKEKPPFELLALLAAMLLVDLLGLANLGKCARTTTKRGSAPKFHQAVKCNAAAKATPVMNNVAVLNPVAGSSTPARARRNRVRAISAARVWAASPAAASRRAHPSSARWLPVTVAAV